MTNVNASPFVRTFGGELIFPRSHNRNMARRGIPTGPISWYLVEWMDACGLSGRGAQARMSELTGWSKATMSQLFNSTQDYSPKVVTEAARALNVEVYELFMPPARAMHMRRMRETALNIAAEDQAEYSTLEQGAQIGAVE